MKNLFYLSLLLLIGACDVYAADKGATEQLVMILGKLPQDFDNNSYEITNLTVKSGWLLSLIKEGADPNASYNGGPTSLHVAAAAGRLDLIKELFLRGAIMNAKLRHRGDTPFDIAIKHEQPEAARLIGNFVSGSAEHWPTPSFF